MEHAIPHVQPLILTSKKEPEDIVEVNADLMFIYIGMDHVLEHAILLYSLLMKVSSLRDVIIHVFTLNMHGGMERAQLPVLHLSKATLKLVKDTAIITVKMESIYIGIDHV